MYLDIYITVTLVIVYYFKVLKAVEACIDLYPHLRSGEGLNGTKFWSATTEDVVQCARLCVRRIPCKSVTFDLMTNVCELSKESILETTRITGKNLVYSEFLWWPTNIDSICITRPCGEYEVCVPDLNQNNEHCSYACMKVSKPVCPLPAALNGSRTIGSVNIVTCNLGYTGGGIAACQSNLQWTDTVLACEPILNHDCVEDTLCLEIDATCIDSVCTCGDARIYNAYTHTCEMEPVCPLPAALNGSRTIGSVNMVTCNLGYTGGGIAICQSNLQWTDTVLACETILNHDCVVDTLCLEIDATCIDSVCSCGDARIYNANTHTCEMACPSGWLWNYQSCYYLDSTDRKTFDGAKASCHGMGATLVEVNDEMENTFLASQSMLTSTGFRMALTDIVNEGIWIWDESQTSAVYFNWGSNEPNNGGNDEHCSKFGSTGAWHDIRCYDAREYLCELNL